MKRLLFVATLFLCGCAERTQYIRADYAKTLEEAAYSRGRFDATLWWSQHRAEVIAPDEHFRISRGESLLWNGEKWDQVRPLKSDLDEEMLKDQESRFYRFKNRFRDVGQRALNAIADESARKADEQCTFDRWERRHVQ